MDEAVECTSRHGTDSAVCLVHGNQRVSTMRIRFIGRKPRKHGGSGDTFVTPHVRIP